MNGSNGCYVYVLGTGDGAAARTYVGWTTDVAARLASLVDVRKRLEPALKQ